MAILAHFGDQDPRPPALDGLEALDQFIDAVDRRTAANLAFVDTGNRPHLCNMAAPHRL